LGLARGRWRVGQGDDEIRVFVEDSESGARVRFESGSGPIGIPFSKVDELAALVAAARALIEAATSGTLAIAVSSAAVPVAAVGEAEEGFSLDREKLSALRAETAEVAAFLSQVFQEDVEEIIEEVVDNALGAVVFDEGNPSPGPATGVPHREWVTALSRGEQRVSWDDFEASARAHGISFVDAAMEEINTYVLEVSGDFGLSGSESVEVNTKMLAWVL
jgi:hypothetical protein